MPNIQVLDSHIADLIAAGEVVERPASVAKELLENAIDAGATQVTVEIAHGGMTFLRVSDNGAGIPATQLKDAFLRHATSKLRTQYDLEAIATLGFRGEALAAIAAVSRVEILSRTADAPHGAALSLEGGVAGDVEEAGCPLGTTMVVRDLFFNTPARLKFVKKDVAEGAAVFAVVQRIALSHPEIRVKFLKDGKQELLTPGDAQLQSAVYAVLGRELALGFCPVNSTGEELAVRGFVSLPVCCRASRSWQFFFVNGRLVKSPLLMSAVEEAYKNQRMVGKHPACVLHLETKLSAVDVNVHPAKTEVKFGNERQVFSTMYHAVLSALEGGHAHPTAQLAPSRPAPEHIAPPTVRVQDTTYHPTQPKPAPPPVSAARYRQPTQPLASASLFLSRPIPVPTPADRPAPIAASPMPADRPVPPKEPTPETLPPTCADTLLPQGLPWRMAGEVLSTYIVVEQGDTVYFIDKHAAHERLNFDRLKAEGYQPMAQTLLVPALYRLGVQEQAALLAQQPLLAEFGFEVDALGDCLAVREAPFDVAVEHIEATLTEIAQALLTTPHIDPAAARDALLHTMACKAAIKGGWSTSPQELERVARAVMEEGVKYCPHGRPVAIALGKKELEKQFKRA